MWTTFSKQHRFRAFSIVLSNISVGSVFNNTGRHATHQKEQFGFCNSNSIPGSPDPPDLFVWGYLKINVHASKPKTFDELKNNNVAQIDPDRCTRLKTYLNMHVKS